MSQGLVLCMPDLVFIAVGFRYAPVLIAAAESG